MRCPPGRTTRLPVDLRCSLANQKVVFYHAPQGPDPVLPTNLLSFVVSASGIGDPDFVNPALHLRDTSRNFWFETEPILGQVRGLDNFTAKYLVTGFHVRQV